MPCVALLLSIYWRNIDLLIGISSELYYPSRTREYSIQNAKFVLQRHFDIRCHIPNREPTIYICNYVKDRFENALILFLPAKLTVLATEKFIKSTGVDSLVDSIGVSEKNNYEFLNAEVPARIAKGHSILCYSQKPLFMDNKNYGKMRSGIFNIARVNNLTITPLYIPPIQTQCQAIYNQEINIVAGESLRVYNTAKTIADIKHFFSIHNK